jgi:hypothetical protein
MTAYFPRKNCALFILKCAKIAESPAVKGFAIVNLFFPHDVHIDVGPCA